MKLSRRSFPHPVVGNSDDVPDAAFQATIEGSYDKAFVYIDVDIVCSSETINSLLESSKAKYTVHVECSNTLFRRAYELKKSKDRISIPREELNDDVEVNTFVRAGCDLADYSVEGAHPDYDGATFQVEEGDILAVGEGCVLHVETNFESTARVGSIMQVKQAEQDGDLPMMVETNSDKISVILSKKDFALYKLLKNHDALSGPLTTCIVLPVLVDALHQLKSDNSSPDDPRRWVRVLSRRMLSLGLDQEADLLVAAQKLLELPIRRALTGAKKAEES